MLELSTLRLEQGDFVLSADVAIPQGRFVALLGPSGAGKSTVLAAIGGFLEVASGEIRFNGAPLADLRPSARPVAMLFQDNNLFPHMTVAQNIGLALSKRTRHSTDEVKKIEEALIRVGLAGFGQRMPATLSGGQQSRVALARVLLQDKPIVLLDEPFSALGPGQRAEMMALCRNVLGGSGRTVLFVTHDADDAARADDICVVAEGEVSAPVPASDVLDNPPEVLAQYLGK